MDLTTLLIGLSVALIVILPFFVATLASNPYMEEPLTQDFESIGKPSDELEAVASEKQGWQGSPAKPQVDELVSDFDFSRYDRRANSQALGTGPSGGEQIPNMAGYSEGPMAGHPVEPWDALADGDDG